LFLKKNFPVNDIVPTEIKMNKAKQYEIWAPKPTDHRDGYTVLMRSNAEKITLSDEELADKVILELYFEFGGLRQKGRFAQIAENHFVFVG
jgi:hypothetical protein